MGIAFCECKIDDAIHELSLRISVGLARREAHSGEARSKATFEFFVFSRNMLPISKKVSKRQRPPLLVSARQNGVYVMSMRPVVWTMEEGAKGVVWMRHMNVAEPGEDRFVAIEGVEWINRNLDIDHRL